MSLRCSCKAGCLTVEFLRLMTLHAETVARADVIATADVVLGAKSCRSKICHSKLPAGALVCEVNHASLPRMNRRIKLNALDVIGI